MCILASHLPKNPSCCSRFPQLRALHPLSRLVRCSVSISHGSRLHTLTSPSGKPAAPFSFPCHPQKSLFFPTGKDPATNTGLQPLPCVRGARPLLPPGTAGAAPLRLAPTSGQALQTEAAVRAGPKCSHKHF